MLSFDYTVSWVNFLKKSSELGTWVGTSKERISSLETK